jgi:hypothetical protein
MRKSTIAILGACLMLVATVVPAAAMTDSTTHENMENATGFASGYDEGVYLSVYVRQVLNRSGFNAPDTAGPDGHTSLNVWIYTVSYTNDTSCVTTVKISGSDAVFNFSLGHATLSFDSDCGPVNVVWTQAGELTVTQRNEITAGGTRIAQTEWFRDATMTATVDGLVVDDFSEGASLYRYNLMYKAEG